MVARGRVGGETPERIVTLLREAVKASSQSAVARDTGLRLYSVQRYLKGVGEPTTDTMEKLANYFKVSVAWLRGEEEKFQLDRDLFDRLLPEAISGIWDNLREKHPNSTKDDFLVSIKNSPEAVEAIYFEIKKLLEIEQGNKR